MASKILIVDDEEDIVDIIALEFEDSGFEVFKANGGNEALELMQKQKVDVVITDLMMPDGDGLALIRKGKIIYPTVFYFIMTAYYENVGDINNLGLSGFISKPALPSSILELVEEVLHASKRVV